jgi:hypothetical protein
MMTTSSFSALVTAAAVYGFVQIVRIVVTTWSMRRLLEDRPEATLQDAGEARGHRRCRHHCAFVPRARAARKRCDARQVDWQSQRDEETGVILHRTTTTTVRPEAAGCHQLPLLGGAIR